MDLNKSVKSVDSTAAVDSTSTDRGPMARQRALIDAHPLNRQAGVTITDLNAGTTTATTQGAGSSGDIRFGIPDVGHFYRARGELRNAGGVALHLSEKTSGVLGNSC